MGSIYTAFPTPLYKHSCQLDKSVINPILRDMEFYRLRTDDGYASVSPWVLDEDFSVLKPMIEKQIEDMCFNNWKFKKHYKFKIQNSWVMKHVKGDHSGIHWPSNSLFSGILYLQCDEDSGDLMFINYHNWCGNMFAFDFEEDNMINQDIMGFTPREGDLVMFPSKTAHMVSDSRSEHSRFCLAFNVWVEGDLNKSHPHSNSQLSIR